MALTGLQFLLVVLAVYRATRLLVKDDIFVGLRDRIELWSVRHDEQGHAVRGKIQGLITCPYCMSWWLSIVGYIVACLAARRWSGTPLWAHAVEAWAVMGGAAFVSAVDAWMEQTNKAATEISDGSD